MYVKRIYFLIFGSCFYIAIAIDEKMLNKEKKNDTLLTSITTLYQNFIKITLMYCGDLEQCEKPEYKIHSQL